MVVRKRGTHVPGEAEPERHLSGNGAAPLLEMYISSNSVSSPPFSSDMCPAECPQGALAMSSYKVNPRGGFPYFCTCTIMGWQPVFVDVPYRKIIMDSLCYCRQHKGIEINAYVIMLTHVHLILRPLPGVDLAGVMRDTKRYTAKRIFEQLEEDRRGWLVRYFRRAPQLTKQKSAYKVWQDEYHPEQVETERFFMQKLNYLHENPVRKGHVAHPHEWLYSSARYYAGHETGMGVLEPDFLEW